MRNVGLDDIDATGLKVRPHILAGEESLAELDRCISQFKLNPTMPSTLTAIGMLVFRYSSFISGTWPGRSGSSMKSGLWGSKAAANCLARVLWTRPWKSRPTSIPMDLTSFSR